MPDTVITEIAQGSTEGAIRIGGLDQVVLQVRSSDARSNSTTMCWAFMSSASCSSRGWSSCAPAPR